MMILFSLFPSGVLQVRDVLENGYWHARSLDYLGGALPRLLEWLRLPGDLVFYLPGRAADPHRRWVRLFEPVVGTAPAGATRPARAA